MVPGLRLRTGQLPGAVSVPVRDLDPREMFVTRVENRDLQYSRERTDCPPGLSAESIRLDSSTISSYPGPPDLLFCRPHRIGEVSVLRLWQRATISCLEIGSYKGYRLLNSFQTFETTCADSPETVSSGSARSWLLPRSQDFDSALPLA